MNKKQSELEHDHWSMSQFSNHGFLRILRSSSKECHLEVRWTSQVYHAQYHLIKSESLIYGIFQKNFEDIPLTCSDSSSSYKSFLL